MATKSPIQKKKNVTKITPEQRSLKRKQNALHKTVMSVFKSMGFEYLRTAGKEKVFCGQKGEIDCTFLFNNIILFVEETISIGDNDHLRTKSFYYEKMRQDFSSVLNWLKFDYKEKFDKFDKYNLNQYKFFYIYVAGGVIDNDTRELYNNFKFIDDKNLKYFGKISSSIKRTSILELYKFLKLELRDIGHGNSGSSNSDIETAIIMPESSSGFPEGIQVVTFAMRAKELMECSYVLRKDSWDQSIGLYQRLIDKAKIDNIRNFLANKQRTFVDNIIVSLPYDASFSTKSDSGSKTNVNVFDKNNIENLTINIPYKINSIGIIDGQHRIFGHYVGTDPLEPTIQILREKRHLLVTGLFFDKSKIGEADKRKFESELFLQINSQQKKVDTFLLQYIQSLEDPNSPIGIASNVLSEMNKRSPFTGMFMLSALDSSGIKSATILKHGLQVLVEQSDSKNNLFKYWKLINPLSDISTDQSEYEKYILFCSSALSKYFNALKANQSVNWNLKNADSKLLSVTSITGFLLAYKKALEVFDGPKEFEFYKEKLANLSVQFNRKSFNYVSSHWTELSEKITDDCWR